MEKYKFQAKSEEGLLDKALSELNLKEEDVLTKYYEEKGGLFGGKKYTIEVVKLSDIAELGKELLNELLNLNVKEVVVIDNSISILNELKNMYQVEITYSKEFLSEGYDYLFTDLIKRIKEANSFWTFWGF